MPTSAQIRIPGLGRITGDYEIIPSVGHYIVHAEKESETIAAKVKAVVWLTPGFGENPFDDSLYSEDGTGYEVVVFADRVDIVDAETGAFSA